MKRLNTYFSWAVLTYHWRCAACGKVLEQAWKLYPGEACVLASVPDGWRRIEGVFYCPDHKIEISIDGVNKNSFP
jgi:hypothetical protein